jgi:hypothetical protein
MYREKQYFAALMFSHPMLSDVDTVIKRILGDPFESVSDVIASTDTIARHMHFVSGDAYHRLDDRLEFTANLKRPQTRRIGGTTFFLYDCYLLQFKIDQTRSYFIFAAPFKKMIKDSLDASAPKLASERLSFHFIKLIKLCDQFARTDVHHNLKVTRINLQAILGIAGVKSISLFGDDVLISEPYERVRLFTSPSAIRIFFDNEAGSTLPVNTDRAGNWSFYLKSQNNLGSFREIMFYLHTNGLLGTSYNDPRKRLSPLDQCLDME